MTVTDANQTRALPGARNHPQSRKRVACLVAGALISLLAVGGPWDISLAAWIAPMLLLRFTRMSSMTIAVCGVVIVSMSQFATYSMTSGIPFSAMTAALCAILGAMFAVPYILDRTVFAKLPTPGQIFLLPATATAVEFLCANVLPLGTSVGTRAVTQGENIALLQVTSLLGPYAIAFLIGCLATVANHVWEDRSRMAVISWGVPLVLTLLGTLVLGQVRLTFASNQGAQETVRIAGIVPRIDLREAAKAGISMEDFNAASSARVKHASVEMKAVYENVRQEVFAETAAAIASGAKIVMWSETAVPVLESDKAAVLEQTALLAQQANVFINAAFGVPYERNETYLIGPDGLQKWHYRKNNPVPGMEPIAAFANEPPVLETTFGRLSNVICFDADFPNLSRLAADIMLVPAWDWPEVGYTHTMKNARLRSIENGY